MYELNHFPVCPFRMLLVLFHFFYCNYKGEKYTGLAEACLDVAKID